MQGVDCVRKAADELSADFSRGGDEWTKREGMLVGKIPIDKGSESKGLVTFVVGDWFKMTPKVLSPCPQHLNVPRSIAFQ